MRGGCFFPEALLLGGTAVCHLQQRSCHEHRADIGRANAEGAPPAALQLRPLMVQAMRVTLHPKRMDALSGHVSCNRETPQSVRSYAPNFVRRAAMRVELAGTASRAG